MTRKVTDLYLRKAAVVFAMAAVCMAVGCSADPPPPEDLSSIAASTLISQKWAQNELNHFTVTFHSDTLIGCGVQNDLWKRVETPYQGVTISTYQLTETGRKAIFAIDLKESGKSHEVILQGPYLNEVTGITPGSQPDTRQVAIRWDIDWNKAPAALKACLPRSELSGSQVALFKLTGQEWSFLSFLKPEEVTTPPQATSGGGILR
ncbi:MAG TPA: hypothetical protein VKE70_02300 [Candidatus Solibacter sp.]|nr:hypothetical protein [Candidatus Solibacter sp.]